MSKKKKRRILTWILALAVIAVAVWYVRQKFFGVVHLRDKYAFVYIEPKDLLEDVVTKLHDEGIITEPENFEWLALRMKLDQQIHPGKYRILNGMSHRQIINLIRYGKEEKVKLSLNSQIRDAEEFIQYADEKLSLTEDELESVFGNADSLEKAFQSDTPDLLAVLVPATYEVGWAITLRDLVAQLKARYDQVYSAARRSKAKKIGYSLGEVQVIASIVQSESAIPSEQRKIAGVYINRLRKGMALQADPTLKYACRNYEVQRILDKDKEVDSPYNTYRYKGLPPGPICMVGSQALDATLNYERHNYLYFCARPDLNGYSFFSTTYDEHRKHAIAYRKELDRLGIAR